MSTEIKATQTTLSKSATPVQRGFSYVSKSRGVPVEIGQDWRDLTAERRKQHFWEQENHHKTRFAQLNGQGASMAWTRG